MFYRLHNVIPLPNGTILAWIFPISSRTGSINVIDGRAEAQQLHAHSARLGASEPVLPAAVCCVCTVQTIMAAQKSEGKWGQLEKPNNAPNKFHHGQTT